MKRLLVATALAAGLFLTSGCSTLGALTGSVAATAPATTAQAEKVLTVAHLALNAVAANLLSATASCVQHHDNSCLLHGANAATAKMVYDKADDALRAADALDIVANAQGVVDKVDAAETLIAQVSNLIPKK